MLNKSLNNIEILNINIVYKRQIIRVIYLEDDQRKIKKIDFNENIIDVIDIKNKIQEK